MKNTLTYTAVLAASTTLAFGAGFQLQERSASGLGRAFSGEAAIADDASVLASNPAGIILLDDNAFSIGLSYINPQADVSGEFNTIPGSADDIGDIALVPHIYLTKKYNDNVSYGIGIFTTYGLKSEYGSDFIGSAVADQSELESVNFNAALALRIDEKLTIGLGANLLYADGTLNSSNPFTGDTLAEVTGDDFGVGFNIGALYEFSEQTRIGLHYRSKVDLSLSGETDIPGFAINGLKTGLDVELPETIEASIYHELDSQWAVHADVVWTNWDRYNGIQTETAVPAANFNDPSEWSSSFRYSVGATYKHCDKWTFRAGVAYDESPVGDGDRGLRIPDNDRIWASVGVSYQICENYRLDAGYTHLFIEDADLGAARNTAAGGLGAFEGEVSGDVDIFSIALSGNF